jgi:hypothetical protein
MADNERDGTTSFLQTSRAKKPYVSPELLRWGTMRDITLSAGNKSSHSDGAKKGPNRTS